MEEKALAGDLDVINELVAGKKYRELRELLADMHPQDIPELMEQLDKKDIVLLFRLLPKEMASEVFVEMDSDEQKILVEAFTEHELKEVFDELYLDDTVDIIEEMPANVVKRILKISDPETRKLINEVLKYPDDSAGSIMTVEYVRLQPEMTVSDAFTQIRRVGIDKETIYTCYVTNRDKTLVGIVTAKDLMLSDTDKTIGEIMEEEPIYVDTLDDKEDVAALFNKYNYLAIPVVDKEKRLVGIVTVDDAIDVMQEEATEDIEKMAAIMPTDKPYLKTGIFETWRKRIPWLLLLMVSATVTGNIISSFETALASSVVLTAFIPMLMDTGGNAGGQASVTIIRALSLGDVSFKNIFTVIWKEIRVAVMCGVSLAVANFVKILLVDNALFGHGVTVAQALVVCITLVATVTIAKLVGCTLPMLAKKIGFDPAVMASPFITTIVDAISLLIYFGFATTLLGI